MLKIKYYLVVIISGLVALSFTACSQKSNDPSAEVLGQASSAISFSEMSSDASAANAALMCGTAPTGELVAERIPGANTTRTEDSLYEGPVWINGALYFSDFLTAAPFVSRIQKLDSNGVMTTLIDDSGTNGLAVDAQGNIVAATHKIKGIARYSLSGVRTLITNQYKDHPFDSPNDLTIAKDGTIYFTDPAFQRDAAPGGQEKTGVYRVAPDGIVSLVDDTIDNPNGIALSLDEKTLYVNGGGEMGFLRAYPIKNGIPQAGKNLVNNVVVPDGMALDCHGNIYMTEHMAHQVRVFTPEGKQIATIKVDAKVTNVAFGGADGKTMFLTGAGAVWKLPLDVTGTPY